MKRFAVLFMLLALFSFSLAALCQNENLGTNEYKAFKEKLALEAKGEAGDIISLEFSENIFLGKGANDFGPAPDPVWANHFGGSGNDYANAVVTDNSGNIYATGTFSGTITVNATEYNSVGTNDAFVAKLSNTGTIIWFTQISTTAGNTVSSNDIAIDASGNLYITGHYTGVLTLGAAQLPDINGFQFFYARLNASGSIVNGAYHSEDENERGIFIDVDNSGNVYATVTKSLSTDSRHESWILKYDSNANLLWAKSFDESFNSVIVYGENLFFSGVMNNYNDGYIDESLTLAMPISYNDIFIAKSDLNGNFIWGYVANHSTYGDSYQGYIDTDGNGNFYLTGFNRGSIDFSEHSLSDDGDFVGKFDEFGTFSWLYKISTSGTSKISIDGSGNCYVAKNLEIFMLNPLGEWQWSVPITKYAREIEVSSSGKIVEVGTINGLAYTSQFVNAGVEEWTTQFNGNSGTGRVEGLVTDNAGNIYTYGNTTAPANYFGQEIGVGTFICKQDASGNVVWINQFPSLVEIPSQGNSIIVDKQSQYVYICGYFEDPLEINGSTTLTPAAEGSTFVVKYDVNGNYINHLQEDFVGGGVISIVTDYSGNLILTDTYSGSITVSGNLLSSAGSYDGYLAKYDSNLNAIWVLSVGGENTEYNFFASADAADNIYVTGEFNSQNVSVGNHPHTMNDGDGNILFAKINSSGEVQWAKSLAAAGSNSSDYSCWPTGIVSNDLGETYIKGWHGKSTFFDEIEITSPYSYNYFITKLDTDGNVLWANSINEATYGFDYNQFAVDASGSVYLGAQAKGALTFSDSYTYTPSSGYDLFVAKYRTDGVLDWVKTIQSMGSYYSWISSVAVYNNEIYVGGYFDGYLNIDGQELQTNTRHGFVAKLQNQIYDVTFNVDMTGATQFIPGTDNVYLSGTMYNWAEPASTKASQPLSQVGETMIWSITLPLIEGGYSYKYFINEGSEGIEWLDGPKREIEVVEEIPSDDVWASAYPELFAGGSGTEDNPFLISNAEQLNNVRQFLDAYYLQTADIDLDVAPWNEGEGWEPIGNATIKFSGSYNGNYQIINNLYINRSSVNLQGLFGITSNAVIKNIKLLNVNVTGKNYIGAIAGQSNYSSIGNCLSTGTITGTTYVGGLVGFNQYGDINQCFSSSNVTGTNYIGGVTGVHQGDNLLLNSYSTGTLTGGDNVGGLVGTTAVNSLIENSYFAGSISGASGLGGLVAYRFSVSAVKNSFWDTQTSGVATTEVGGEGKTTAEMKDIFTYTSAGWDFKGLGAEGIWNIDPDGYPYLNWIYPENTSSQVPVLANVLAEDVVNTSGTEATVNATITCIGNPEFTQHGVCWNTTGEPTTADSKTTLGTISELMFGSDITGLTPNTVYYVRAYAENTQGTAYSNELTFVTVVAPTGDGSPETPYQISSLAELYWLATTPSVWGMNFIQTNDIDASQTANWNNGQGFQPIGNIENPFMGIYNGNGFLISNVTINQPDNDYVGVFGKIQDAILYQVGVANANIVGSSYVGALAGGVSFSIVEQCFTSGSVEGKGGNDGGLFGVTEQGEVRSCYSTCSVTGYVGSPGQGGLIGLVNETSIRGCYSMGLVTSPYANGLIGNINGGEVENCYWDTETSGCLSSVAGTGKTTTEMKDISTFLNGGWDFKGLGTEGVWNIGNERNDGYPYLNWQYPEDPAISMEILPSAVITNVTNITQNSASFQIEVTNIGNPQGISFGVCWSSTNPEPTVEDFSRVSEENFALGSFIEDVFEFTHSTVYYARAFASSTNGTAYSDVVTFNTECGAHSLPLTENFDNSYEFPNCWNAFTVGDGSVLIYNFEPTSNPNHAWLFAQVVGAEAYLVLPELDADINTLNLQFMSKSGATGYGWPSDMVLEIGTMTDPTNASTFSYFTHIQTQDIYEQQNISLATFGGTDRYIAFRVSSNIQEQAGYVFIDDVNIVSNISSSLVTFNVDMTNASGFNPAEDVVYITGSMFGWAEPGANPDNQTMTRVEESMIWTKTIEVAQGNYEYKYFLNAGWDNGEWPGEPNRQIGVNDNLTINDTWGRYGLQFTSPTSEDVFDICDGELNVSISSEGLGEVSGNIYFIDAMGSWYWVAAYYSNGNGITNYSYNIPLEISRGTCRLYLDSNVGSLYGDYFTVTNNSTIGFTQPLAAQTYQVGVDSEIPVQLMFNGCISSCGSLYFDRIDQWVGIGEVCFDTENTTYSTSYSIPGNIISGNYRFVYYGEGIEIFSEYFTITNPNVTLTFNSPNESDTYEVGVDSYIPVEFEHAGLGYLYFNLYIVDQNQTLHYVANYYAENDGVITHNHALTENYPTGEYTYRLDYSNYNDIYGSIYSNQFQIINNQAALSLVNPQTNGYFMPGNSMNISWNSNAISNVDIHYSLDNGFTWNLIEANVETQNGFQDWGYNSYEWQIPTSIEGIYEQSKIRIRNSADHGLNSESGLFTISSADLITFIAPVAGTAIETGDPLNITMDVFSESWVSLELHGQYIGYGIDGISATVGTNTITTEDTYMLSPGTYRVRAYHNNSGIDVYSDEFTVTCPTVTLPLVENFDRTSNLPGCWFTTGDNGWNINIWNDFSSSSPNSAAFSQEGIGYAILATPEITQGLSNLRVRFNALYGNSADYGILYVGTISETLDGSTFNTVESFEISNGDTWTSIEVLFDEYSGTDNHIAFRLGDGIGETYSMVFIDNIIIDEIPACLEPYNLAVGAVTQPSAEVSWVEPGTSTQWDIIYGHAGFDPQTEGTIVAGVTSNTYTLTDLSHSTSYEFYVRTYCGGNPSGWSLPGEFTTECGPVELSFFSPDENQTYDFSISNQIPYSFEYLGCEEFYLSLYLYDEEENNGWNVTGDWYNKSITLSEIYSAPATLPNGTYKFRMEYWYNEQTNYVYSNEFEVVNNVPAVEVTNPGSWSYWISEVPYTISWNSLNVSGVNLSYSLDNGNTWNSIENGVASQNGSNNYTFEVPVSINGHFEQSMIRIEDASNSSTVDYSDQFTISNIPPFSIIEPNALTHVEILGEMDIVIENEFESWISLYVIDSEDNWTWIGDQNFTVGQSSFSYSTNNFEVDETYRIYAYHYNMGFEVYADYFTVSKATPTITEWPTASGITYGDALSASNLTGGYAEHNGIEVAGVFTFDSPSYEPGAGLYLANVTFTPTDGEIFSTVSGMVEVTVAKANPVISMWPVASAITYGDAISQSSLSGGTVDVAGAFTFNTPATKPNAGTYAAEVTFTPTDNANYIFVEGTVDVTVSQALLTIIANSFSKEFGVNYIFVGNEFTTNPIELVGNDVVTSVALASAGAESAAIEGDYPVIPSSAVGSGLSNYSITYQNGTLSVVNRTILTIEGLTIAEKEYDGTRTAVVLSWGSLTGFEETFENVQLDITNAVILFDNKNAGNNKTVIVTGLALTGDDEWLYAINDQIVSGNILPKPLTIAAQNCSKTYGETDPDFTVSYNGFIAGENESVLEGTLSVSREPGEDVDSYAITPSGLSSNNYSITFDAGVFTIAPKELIVTATNAEKVYGSIDPVFAASYSGFEFGENQSVLTGELHLTREVGEDVDSYSITPSGLSASNYSISYVSGVLTITPKTLTITAENKTKVYGSDDPAFSIEYSGFVAGDDLTSLSGSLGYTREAGEDVGTYAVNPNGYSSINYNINYVDGLLGITKKALVVSADNVEKVYGSNDPDFTVSYTGFAFDEDNTVLAGTLAFSREVGEDAGFYVITPSGLSSTNYSISFVNGVFTIIPKDLTISAVNSTKVYGESDPQFAATYSGFITGEDETLLSGNIEFSRADGEDVGEYAVTPEGLTSNNYNLIFASTGKLTVTPKPLTVTASNATKIYGSSDPAFTVTYSEFAFSENQLSLGGTLAFDRIAGETVGNYTITPSGLLSDNYNISYATGSLAITPKGLTITAENKSKVYGQVDPVFTITYTGFITGEDESVLSGTLAIDRVAGEDVGTYVITPSGLTATNYSVTFTNGSLIISALELSVGGTFTVANREYDGLIAAAIATNSLTLTGALSSDNVTLNPVAAFADKNVGASKIISLTNASTLTGTDAGNYTLSLTGAPTATANITPKALSVTGATVADKVYDGTTNAAISEATLAGTVGNDVVTLGNATTGTFAQKSVGTDIAVTTAMTISGTDASNYTITQPSGLQADITTKELTVGGTFSVHDKVYDGTAIATISENNLTLLTPVTGDVVSLAGVVVAFADAEVGNDKVVNITSASLDGTDNGNYSLSLTGAPTATANITASSTTTFTVTFSVVNGNGTLTATVDGNAISSGDEVLVSKDVVFTATPASGYQVKVWTTNGNPIADNTTNSLTVDNLMENTTVIVEFEEIPPVVYTLTLEVNPQNSGTVSGAGQYEENEQVSITATPAEGFVFQNWRFNGTVVSSEASVTYTMPAADVTLVAYFIEESVETYTLTLVANPVEGGLVIGGGEFAEGEVVTVTAQPSEGYQFVNWVITVPEALEGTEVSTEATTTFTMLAEDVTLTANFEMEQPETYTVTFTIFDNQENPVQGATIAIDGIDNELITDASGMTTIELEDGEYSYSVTKEGFEAESGTFTVAGEDITVDVDLTTVGLNTDVLSNIEVYPNPFSSSITLNNVGKASRVVVTSLIGQKVMEVKLSGAERETIQTESLANGIYLIHIYNANGDRTVRKMMKE